MCPFIGHKEKNKVKIIFFLMNFVRTVYKQKCNQKPRGRHESMGNN